VAAFLQRESLVIGTCALYAVIVLLALPQVLVQDSWLTLVDGREIVRHGLPAHDHFAVWTSGDSWIDQQWLAQLVFYGLFALGGLKLVLLSHVGLLTAAFGSALASARLRGASEKSVCLAGFVAMLAAPWELQFRAQTLGTLLFVWVLALLLADSRRPSRRVLLVLPLLAFWANVHGTVLLGAALAAVRAVTILVRRTEPHWRLRAGLLLVGAPLCTFASPYGLSLVGYYHRIVANPLMSEFVVEWKASTPSRNTAVFYLLAFLTVWLVARATSRLTAFERLALFVTMLGGLWAIRSITWFVLTDLMVLPLALDAALPSRPRRARFRTYRIWTAIGAAGLVLIGAGAAAAASTSYYLKTWPTKALPAIREATAKPSTRVFADDRYADWLVWELPELRGRIAYDVRFELFDSRQFNALHDYRAQHGDDWRRAAKGFQVLTFEPLAERAVWRTVRRDPGTRVLYADKRMGVLTRRSG
jgi:hypothetical protein